MRAQLGRHKLMCLHMLYKMEATLEKLEFFKMYNMLSVT